MEVRIRRARGSAVKRLICMYFFNCFSLFSSSFSYLTLVIPNGNQTGLPEISGGENDIFPKCLGMEDQLGAFQKKTLLKKKVLL